MSEYRPDRPEFARAICTRLRHRAFAWSIMMAGISAFVTVRGADSDRAKAEFFEAKIRPVLVERCYECHSSQAKTVKGGLRLDTREGVLAGGDSGAAVVPGQPEESPLFLAIQYEGGAENMPPKGKLAAGVIDDFRKWILDGAYDPRAGGQVARVGGSWEKTLRERLDWWAFKPMRDARPPVIAGVGTPIDAFLAEKLHAEGLDFAPEADRPTLLRRLHFDLTGLPPTPGDLAAFLADESPNAYEKVVDRLLASPHFGERMARRWMDLMRYSETVGSEQDALIPYAWTYRDYLIRAFNADLPYDQFVREHLAGDLIPPRRDPATGLAESPIGTAWLRFVEYYHSPVDVKNEEITVIDNQVDTLGKAFLGLTIACARCHDHKFDPIGTDDFYRYYGILRTARATVHRLNDPASFEKQAISLESERKTLRQRLGEHWGKAAESLDKSLPGEFRTDQPADPLWADFWKRAADDKSWARPWAKAREAIRNGTDSKRAWAEAWGVIAGQAIPSWEIPATNQKLIADFTKPGRFPDSWHLSGAFVPPYSAAGTFRPGFKPEKLVEAVRPSGLFSDAISEKMGMTLRSPEFELTDGTYSALVTGTAGARLRLVVDNFQGVDILFAGVTPVLNEPRPTWVRLPVREIWKGRRAYLELVTRDEMPSTGVIRDLNQLPRDGRSSAGIRYVVHHPNQETPREAFPLAEQAKAIVATESLEGLTADRMAETLAGTIRNAVDAFRADKLTDEQAAVLQTLLDSGLLMNETANAPELAQAFARFRAMEERVDSLHLTIGVAESAPSAFVQSVFPRGDHRRPGPATPPGDLVALAPDANRQAFPPNTPGRVALAESITRADHPLTARVMVNRLWSWCFGKGLFPTEDNVGRLGEPPSHPELLDTLATEFVRDGYSVKRALKRMVMSRAYRQSSLASELAEKVDPANRLLSHAPVERLDAESLRDAVLTASGRLDRAMFGLPLPTPQPPGLTDDKKPVSGPVDGAGRRSVYLNVRKNFPVEFLEVFDRPRPTLPVGRRNVSNQPAQALAMLNDPFVRGEAARLGEVLQRMPDIDDEGRVRELYRRAFGRDPRSEEIARAIGFVRQGAGWGELAHAVFCMKEFLYVP